MLPKINNNAEWPALKPISQILLFIKEPQLNKFFCLDKRSFDLFNDLSKSSLEVPNHLNVSNKKQSGGYNNDLNSMLASDSMNVLSTTTDELENNIKNMLGGKSKKQNRETNEYSATSSDNIFLKWLFCF